MGLHDRDWYREELAKKQGRWNSSRPHVRPQATPSWMQPRSSWWPTWIAIVVLAVLLAAALMKVLVPARLQPPLIERPSIRLPPAPAPVPAPASPAPERAMRPEADAPLRAPVRRDVAPPARAAVEPPQTRQIYLCKAYGGGMFWSSAVCSTQRATIDRIVTVPGHLSWDEQVAYAQGVRREAEQLYRPQGQTSVVSPGSALPARRDGGQCAALDAQIRAIDAAARQPQSAWGQDQLRAQRQAVRSRQVALRC